MTDEPTQSRYPGRAAARSTAATLVGLGPLVPLLVRELGEGWAAVVIGAGLAGNAVITRLLAVPAVDQWLRHAIPLLAATDTGRRHRS